jgi:hypothetical protein
MTATMEVAIAGPEITASSPPYVVTVAATIATFNETQFKESVLSVMRARKPGRAMMGVVVEVLSMREKDSAAHTKFHPQATVLEVTFQVLKMPVSTLATFTDAISQAGTSNGFPGYNVLSLAVAQPSPSPGPSPSPASSPPVSINPNSPSPSPSPSPKDVIPNPSPKSSPVGPLPTEESNATMIIVIIVVVVVVLVIAAGLTVAYCMYKKSGPAGGLLDSRPSSTSSLKSGGSVITVKSQDTTNSNFGLLPRHQQGQSPRPITSQSQAEQVDIDALRPQTTDKDGKSPRDIENPADSPSSNPLDWQRSASNGTMKDNEGPETPLTHGQSSGKLSARAFSSGKIQPQ